jgi:hypothetical protein
MMNAFRFRALLGFAASLAMVPALHAQRSPNIGYVYPAGGRQGTTFQAAISGQYLDGVTNVIVSGQGVQATIVDYVRPINGKQLLLLRDRLKNMQQAVAAAKKGGAEISVVSESNTNDVQRLSRAAVAAEIAEIKHKLANPKGRRPPNPQLAEDVTLKVVVEPDAEVGDRDLRLLTAAGLSNPMTFRVSQLPEYSKKAEISLSGPRNANVSKYGGRSKARAAEPEMRITLPAVVNGQIMPGGVDRYRFSAVQGQRLVVAASARELIPYIADAVPGWFQATLALYDSKGNELAYDDDFRFNPDPVLYYKIPQDGEYTVEIKDAIYRGREDFVYRITIGELPFVTGIFPLGGRAGQPTTVTLQGWNLPTNTLVMDATGKSAGTYPLSVGEKERVSNHVPFAVNTLPECLEREPNSSAQQAQPVTLPIIVNGRIDPPEDVDVFRFEGQAGDQVVAEVYARRLNSPLDSVLRLTDAAGKQIAFNDDHDDKGAGLITHQADSRLDVTLPARGTYYLHLGDTQGNGGSDYTYRLRISPPQPDFELRVVPSSVNVRAGSVPITVYALRRDGFSEDISLSLKDAPAGFRLSGGRLPGNTNQVRLALTASPAAPKGPVSLRIEGRAKLAGNEIVREAVPAEDMMQAFAYRHLVPAQELEVAVMGRGKFARPGKKSALPTSKTPSAKKPQSQ